MVGDRQGTAKMCFDPGRSMTPTRLQFAIITTHDCGSCFSPRGFYFPVDSPSPGWISYQVSLASPVDATAKEEMMKGRLGDNPRPREQKSHLNFVVHVVMSEGNVRHVNCVAAQMTPGGNTAITCY